jgi:PAS domain S-box-containing protein
LAGGEASSVEGMTPRAHPGSNPDAPFSSWPGGASRASRGFRDLRLHGRTASEEFDMLGVDFGSDAKRTLQALNCSLAIIEYSPDGMALAAIEKFRALTGYKADEIVSKHRRMFVDHVYAESAEYKEFWAKLRRGEADEREYKRIIKGGREMWIRASYNPIFDLDGKVAKAVKFAADVTGRVAAVHQIAAGLSRLAEGEPGATHPDAVRPRAGGPARRLQRVDGDAGEVDRGGRRGHAGDHRRRWRNRRRLPTAAANTTGRNSDENGSRRSRDDELHLREATA